MEHEPWIGQNYKAGISGKRVLIFGYSHWGLPDKPDFTKEVVTRWVKGEENSPFCPRIRAYFGNMEPADFWQSVSFANTLPTSVGEEEERYRIGTLEQVASVGARVLRIIQETQPDRIFVFSRRAWKVWPEHTGGVINGTLRVPDIGEFDAGTYEHGAGEAIAFSFAHPQYAPVGPTRTAVQKALVVEPDDLGEPDA